MGVPIKSKRIAPAAALLIAAAVNSSSHGGQFIGNIYLPATVKIVQHALTRQYIASHLEDDKAFMVKNFGSGRGIENIKACTPDIVVAPGSTVSLDLGDK
jgi:cyclase